VAAGVPTPRGAITRRNAMQCPRPTDRLFGVRRGGSCPLLESEAVEHRPDGQAMLYLPQCEPPPCWGGVWQQPRQGQPQTAW
jgi:hypothetical protein